jgi:hypothetical protein
MQGDYSQGSGCARPRSVERRSLLHCRPDRELTVRCHINQSVAERVRWARALLSPNMDLPRLRRSLRRAMALPEAYQARTPCAEMLVSAGNHVKAGLLEWHESRTFATS